MVEESKIQELVTKAKQGDKDAFGAIYDALGKPVFNFLFARIRNREAAEDLLQTVFLKVWNNLAGYQSKRTAKFSTWLFQIANYTLIDHWRTRKETVDLTVIENLSDFAADPKLYEKYDYLYSAIKLLPQEYQTIIQLRFQQDLSVSEVANIMDKSEVSIRVLQHRAIKLLRTKLSNFKTV